MSGIQVTAAVHHLRSVATTQATFSPQVTREQQAEWLIADLIEQQAAEIERLHQDNLDAVRAYASEITEAKEQIARTRALTKVGALYQHQQTGGKFARIDGLAPDSMGVESQWQRVGALYVINEDGKK